MNFIKKVPYFLCLLLCVAAAAQEQGVHPQSTSYEWPTDPLVRAKLDKWQDQKFGMIIHWGLYAVPGIIESWSLCSEDWIERDSGVAYDDYKKWYWGLQKDFIPTAFNPDQWAAAAKSAGMKYLVFTTKHHDGFNMFDTKQTDFSIAKGPFAAHPKKDVAKHVFDAFRKEGLMIGAYYSKPDWHSEYYWWPKYATADRNNNYDIRKYPARWDAFKKFTHAQINELMNNYGAVDILWLDGGWVRPLHTVNEEVKSWGARIPEWSQDIDMPALAQMARAAQPGLLIVDRTVHGPYENYQTPEQRVPDKQLPNPWESCITLGGAWGWVPNDQYKPASKVIHQLIEVVAKGGSLLLGVGPKADGTLPEAVVQRLGEIGDWLDHNGDAIYATRTVPDYQQGNIFFTQKKDSSRHYALALVKEGDAIPPTISWKGHIPKNRTKVTLLQTGEKVSWKKDGESVIVTLPQKVVASKKFAPALAFAFEVE